MVITRFFLLVSSLVFALGIVRVNGETKTFRSRPIPLGPGEVANYFYRLEMPSGHVGIKSFSADLVDEDGREVPLSEVYIHHWVVNKMHKEKDAVHVGTNYYVVTNSGTCQGRMLPQFFGLGSETRRTEYKIPDPYVVEVGNPNEIPHGYEEEWLLNIHTIDTRGAVNAMHCLECRCAAYNVSVTEYGKIVPQQYVGGLECCLHGYKCASKEGFHGGRRNLYLQYTVVYFPMEPILKPVRIYIFDVTDDRKAPTEEARCKVEFNVPPCDKSKDIACQHEMNALVWLPEEKEVDVLYVNGHLHVGGISLGVHREDGREMCTSEPIYGTGHEAGNETGYVVGMSSCFPKIGTMRIKPGETLRLKAVYNSEELHTGVMGLMYFLVVDAVPNERGSLSFWNIAGAVLVIAFAVAIIGFSLVRYTHMKRSNVGYESLVQA